LGKSGVQFDPGTQEVFILFRGPVLKIIGKGKKPHMVSCPERLVGWGIIFVTDL